MKKNLQFGWAEVDITPKEKISLAGQFYERISDEVETPISVTALAIDSGDDHAVICSCDIACVREPLIALVREMVADVPGLDPKKVVIGATHTHTSYEYDVREKNALGHIRTTVSVLERYLPAGKKYITHAPGESMDPYEAGQFIAGRIAAAVRQAWEARAAGYFAPGFGRAAVGMCRRVVYDDGSAAMWGDSNTPNFVRMEGGNDSGIELLYFFNADKKLTGILANVACPSQVVEQRSFISSDYWGKVKITLREHFGEDLFVLGLASPAGDQCPRDLVRWVDPETPIDDPNVAPRKASRRADPSMYDIAGTWKIGRRISHEIIDAYDEALPRMQDCAEFVHSVTDEELPLRRATIAQYNEAVEKIKAYFAQCEGDINYSDNAGLYVYAGTILRFEGQETQNLVPVELHVLRLGDVAMASNPFELFLDYGNVIRARSAAKQTFLFQLTAGNKGYLPTEKAEAGGHYSAYISSGTVGHEGGDLLVRKTLTRISDMF